MSGDFIVTFGRWPLKFTPGHGQDGRTLIAQSATRATATRFPSEADGWLAAAHANLDPQNVAVVPAALKEKPESGNLKPENPKKS